MEHQHNGDKTAQRAIIALALISLVALVGGIIVAYFEQSVGAIVAVATGAVGGIVAIVLRQAKE